MGDRMRRPNWTKAEDDVLREHYPLGRGPEACMPGLPLRTYDSIVQRACKLQLTVKRVIVNHRAKDAPPPASVNVTPLSWRAQECRRILAEHAAEKATVEGKALRYLRKEAMK